MYHIVVLSSDDFELVADSGEEDDSTKNDPEDFKDDKEKDVTGSKEEENGNKPEAEKGDKDESDVVMKEESLHGDEKERKVDGNGEKKNSNGGIKEKKKSVDEELKELTEKEGDGAGLGFHIKTYEEILREKALRKMLERRQQLQKEKEATGTAERQKADAKEVGKGSVEKQGMNTALGLGFKNIDEIN